MEGLTRRDLPPPKQSLLRWSCPLPSDRANLEQTRLEPRTFVNGTRALTTRSPTLCQLSYRDRHTYTYLTYFPSFYNNFRTIFFFYSNEFDIIVFLSLRRVE